MNSSTEKMRRWRKNNPEKYLANHRRWRAKNREKIREYSRKQRQKDPTKSRAAASRWAKANKEKRSKTRRETRARNIDVYREKERAYRATRKEHFACIMRENHLRKMYGVTSEWYNALHIKQRGKCAICVKAPIDGRPLFVDHNHITGQARGLLCSGCNMRLGVIEDAEFNAKANEYLHVYQ